MTGDGLDEDDDDDDEGSDFDIDETDLESYSTVLEANEDIDEFQIFCESLQSKSLKHFPDFKSHLPHYSELQSDTTGYNQALLQSLTPEQRTQIQNIIHYTEKRKQEKGTISFDVYFSRENLVFFKESNKLRDAGGYNFAQAAAAGQPGNFNFAANGPILNLLQNQK